ncbi:MAG: transporter substrate-binding domain-containing protein [Acetobacteraceae bacterium]
MHTKFDRRRVVALAFSLLACAVVLLFPAPSTAQPAVQPSGHELLVGTRNAPPFAMKTQDGAWEGISIDLWRHIAERQGWRYRIVERGSVQDLLDAVTSGQVDVAVAALTVTEDRRKVMDFTQPFFETGLGVAVPRSGIIPWLPVVRTLLSARFGQAILALLALAVLVGTLIWIFERRGNEHYSGGALRGFVAGAWWSAVAMTQGGAAQHGPQSTPGRAIAVVWMIVSVVAIWVMIAGFTAALTAQRLQGVIRDINDLRTAQVGAVGDTSTVGFLTDQRIAFHPYGSAEEGLRVTQSGRIDAFVYDRPLLAWRLQQDFPRLELTPVTFDRQNYAIALPLDSPLRNELDIALLDVLRSPWWREVQFRYLGRNAGE